MADRIDLSPLTKMAVNALAPATGDVLVLWSSQERWPVPRTVASTTHLDDHIEGRTYSTVASVGQLGTATDIDGLVDRLRSLMAADSTLLFCEPTIMSDTPTAEAPHDVTTTLWRAGLTVMECRRERRRLRLRTNEYCWGRARLTPAFAPPRPWAETD